MPTHRPRSTPRREHRHEGDRQAGAVVGVDPPHPPQPSRLDHAESGGQDQRREGRFGQQSHHGSGEHGEAHRHQAGHESRERCARSGFPQHRGAADAGTDGITARNRGQPVGEAHAQHLLPRVDTILSARQRLPQRQADHEGHQGDRQCPRQQHGPQVELQGRKPEGWKAELEAPDHCHPTLAEVEPGDRAAGAGQHQERHGAARDLGLFLGGTEGTGQPGQTPSSDQKRSETQDAEPQGWWMSGARFGDHRLNTAEEAGCSLTFDAEKRTQLTGSDEQRSGGCKAVEHGSAQEVR